MKKIIITKTECRTLAYQMWNYLALYAYSLDVGAPVENLSFAPWYHHFTFKRGFGGRLLSIVDTLYGSYVIRRHAHCTVRAVNEIVELPLSTRMSGCDTLYCIGSFFRNPSGLKRWRNELIAAFTPKQGILDTISTRLAPFAEKRLIGLELRTTPYPGLPHRELLIAPEHVRAALDAYLREHSLTPGDVALIIATDSAVAPEITRGFSSYVSRDDEVTTLFLLAGCSVVLGTNTLWCTVAAWLGNVAHIVVTAAPIDWDYYRGRDTYFENKYATFAQ